MSTSNPLVDETIEVSLDQIIVDPEANYSRFAPDEVKIKDLIESIRANGLINALVVTPHNGSNNQYKLVAGFQRFRALEALGMPARVTIRQDAAMEINTAENIHRKGLTLMDYSALIERMKATGKKGGEIAKEINQSHSWVSQVAQFIKLRESIQKRIHKGEIPFGVARELSAMTEAEQDAAIAKLDNPATKADKKKAKREASKHKLPSVGDLLEGIEPLAAEPQANEDGEVPRETKAVARKREVLAIVAGYLKGKYGAKKLDEKLTELL